jgi:uncharacterized damage-inducible protein DinB
MAGRRSKRSGYTSYVTAEERIHRIETSVQQLISVIERLPADVLYREPQPGEWPVMSTLAHLQELLPYWAHQALGVVNAPEQPFGRTHEDPDRIGAVREHGHDSLDAIVPRIRSSLDECLSTLRSLPAEGWSVVGHSPSRGTMTVEQIVDAFLVLHVEEHAAQTQATLSALGASAKT